MLTIEQIRAARALLGWSQSDLAERADLSQTGIARIENGTNRPNSKTLQKIHEAFDSNDIEFIGATGLRKRSGEVKILRGTNGLREFFNELYDNAKNIGGEICLFNGTPAHLSDWLGDDWYKMHNERMIKIKDNYNYKIIVRKGETSLPATQYAIYKFFPEELFNDKTIYIFGNVVYFRTIKGDDIQLIRIQQPELANSIKVLFNIAWDNVAEDS